MRDPTNYRSGTINNKEINKIDFASEVNINGFGGNGNILKQH